MLKNINELHLEYHEFIKSYNERYKSYLERMIEAAGIWNMKVKNNKGIIGVLKVEKDSYSMRDPYEINFYKITKQGKISKVRTDYLFRISNNILEELNREFTTTGEMIKQEEME